MPPQQKPIDYDAIAKQYGGQVSVDDVVKQFGGSIGSDAAPEGAPATALKIAPGTSPQAAIDQMRAYNREEGLEESGAQGGYGALAKFGYGVGGGAVDAVKGLFQLFTTNPLTTIKGMGQAQWDELLKAGQAYDEGRYSEMAGHGLAGVTPLIGPAAAKVGERIGSGDVAGGLGEGAFLVGSVAAPAIAKGTAKGVNTALRAGGANEKLATVADQLAAKKFTEAVAPRSTAGKNVRLTNQATALAPDVLRAEGMGAWTRTGFGQKVSAKLDEATAHLDEVADARNAGHAFATKPIIDDLLEQRRELTAEAVEGSKPAQKVTERTSAILDERGQPIRVEERTAEPIGRDVVPEHNKTAVAQIDKAIAELRALGSIARYESLRRIRQSYDQAAQAKYNPAVTADFMVKQGEASGAARVTGALRDGLAKIDPETAKANKPYAMWRQMDRVVRAAEELDRARPTVGRRIIGGLTGAIVGNQAAGGVGGVVGAILGRMADSSLVGSPTTQILTARALTTLSDALRKGDVGVAQSTIKRLRALSLLGQTQPKEQEQPE